jgi:O-antigen ligase
MWISALGVFSNYYLHYQQLTYQIGYGQPVPTPVAHNIYSLFLCFAAVSGILLLKHGHYLYYQSEKYLIFLSTLFIIVLMHMLSVRTGLVALYLCLFLLSIRYIIQPKKLKYALIILPLVFLIPYLAIHFIPSLNKKYYYSMYDISRWKSGQGSSYSDSGRLQSMELGINLWKDNKWFGTGIGDLKKETLALAENIYGSEYRGLKPHNQWIYLLAGTGLVGTFLFALGFFVPVFYKKAYRNEYLFYFTIIILFSFLVESSLERSYSIGFHLYFLLLALKANVHSTENKTEGTLVV